MTHRIIDRQKVDEEIGRRLRLVRVGKGLTLQAMGEEVGVSAEEIIAFEAGNKRLTAGLLRDLAAALDVPIGYFFDELPRSV